VFLPQWVAAQQSALQLGLSALQPVDEHAQLAIQPLALEFFGAMLRLVVDVDGIKPLLNRSARVLEFNQDAVDRSSLACQATAAVREATCVLGRSVFAPPQHGGPALLQFLEVELNSLEVVVQRV